MIKWWKEKEEGCMESKTYYRTMGHLKCNLISSQQCSSVSSVMHKYFSHLHD